MRPEMKLVFDTIGAWTEIKLDIIRKYASAYSRIMASRFYHIYIDAFAGPGKHISKETGEPVKGSPKNALEIEPPFKEYHFIDINSVKVAELNKLVEQRPEAHVWEGDCNSILLEKVFPKVEYEKYRRALCLLDPYGLHLNWEVIQTAGHMNSIDMFLNFPIADMNRNVLRRNPENVSPSSLQRMNAYWGDESWGKIAYNTQGNFFNWKVKESNEAIALAFAEHLQKVANFKYVPKPLPMRNSRGAVVYYLFFAAQKELAHNIIEDIFGKYRALEAHKWH
jgi:three-Cys-motif partner protein